MIDIFIKKPVMEDPDIIAQLNRVLGAFLNGEPIPSFDRSILHPEGDKELSKLSAQIEQVLNQKRAEEKDTSGNNSPIGYGRVSALLKRTQEEKELLEKELSEQIRRSRLIAINSSDLIATIDIKTLKFTFISSSVLTMQGITPEEAIQGDIISFMVPESAIKAQKDLELLLSEIRIEETLPHLTGRYQFKRKDGRIYDVEINFSLISDETGQPFEILGITRDITERIGTEKALKASEKQLSVLLANQSMRNRELIRQLEYIYNNAQNAIAMFSVDNDKIRFTSCNQRWATTIGYSSQELEDFDIENLTDRETAFLYRKIIQKAILLNHPFDEYLLWKNYHLHAVVIPIANNQTGKVDSVGALVYDISEQISDKRKIQESEDRFISIFNNSKDAIALISMDLKIKEVNDEFIKLHGSADFPRENIIEAYFPPKYQQLISGFMKNLQSGISIPTFECETYNHKKECIQSEISVSIITLGQEQLLLCIIRDISIKKEMKRLLAKVGSQIENRERRKLAADLHDNVGPLLSSMNMYLSVLSRKKELQTYHEILDDIRRILKDTITSVREISNNLSPQVLYNFGLTAALDHFFDSKQKLIGITVNNTIGAMRFNELKETMIYNIIIEAFNNTLKHANASQIDLKINIEDNLLCIRYSDNGCGFIPEKQLRTTGKNLGLFSMINRAEIIEGDYSIESAPGKGFLLKMTCPLT